MKTFFADIFPKVQRFSKKLDNLTLLTNQHWVSIDNIFNSKTVYIFRKNNELLISTNGQVERGTWEYLGNKSILINKSNQSYLFKQGFFDENILAMKVDSKDEYAVFVNENKFEGDINSLDKVITLLENKYFDKLNTIVSNKSTQISFNYTDSKLIDSKLQQGISNAHQDSDPRNKEFYILVSVLVIIMFIMIIIANSLT